MRRLEHDGHGGPELVHLASHTLRKPQEKEAVVRVEAPSINPLDWKIRRGVMKLLVGSKLPRTMGTDFSGTGEAVGSEVSNLKPGDAVPGAVPVKNSGAFAPTLITAQDHVVLKPANLSFAAAACLPVASVNPWPVPIKIARLKRGRKLFINGATGAVGRAAIAIARERGAEVTGRVSPQSVDRAESIGLGLAVDYTKPLPTPLDGIFDVILDANGSLSRREGDRPIKRGGKIFDIAPTRWKFLRALGSRSGKVVFANRAAENLQPAVDLASAGKLAIHIAQTISLDKAPAVLASLEQGKRLDGKVVIEL